MRYRWDFDIIFREYPILLEGAIATAKLSVTSFALAMGVGLLICIARMSRFRVASYPALFWIQFFRAIPLLVCLVWFYFAFPVVSGLQLSAFETAVIAIALQSSAFFAEIFRSGIQSLAKGQWDASKAIGMNYVSTMRFVILPQATTRMLPVFFTRTVEIIKSSSLASVISYAEIVFRTREIAAATYRPVESYTVLALIFFCTLFILSRISIYFEKLSAKRER